ncbi:MAG: glycosyltransferase family 1 protein [Deltaproteobacteria bacterium]|nr:glycosyltransferase family 1 protein [Deltaproteobacteria bacterium]
METAPFFPRKLPPGLEPCADLVTDLRWMWSHDGDTFWNDVDPETWERTRNPYVVLQNLSRERLEELAGDGKFRKELERLAEARTAYLGCSCWSHGIFGETPLPTIAYFSMEFGLSEALPIYAGGLGILAGDYLKGASDLGVPVAGVGLLYQEGYFRQVVDAGGRQQEIYPYNDPASLPITPVIAGNGSWLHVAYDFPGRTVRFRVWKAQVGRVLLYLLDSNDPLNSPMDRGITGKLYGGGHEMRLAQEIALGICGWRLIEALGLPIEVCHLNEGHAAFVTLERARHLMEKEDLDFRDALRTSRPGNIFTTHTPVTAGFDLFSRDLLEKYGRDYAASLGVSPHELAALGRRDPDDSKEPFNMAYLALRTCGTINGVSRLHGKVSRRIFQDLFPRWPEQEVPVTHITNGVHVPSWDSPWADEAWTQVCGKDRWKGTLKTLTGAILSKMSDEDLWSCRRAERADLVRYARRRLARHLGQQGLPPNRVAEAEKVLNPDALTLGFARRFAEYKRPNLLLMDPERLIRLLRDSARPVQIIVAGKAHPQDETGKELVRQWTRFAERPEVHRRVVFLEDYDMDLALEMVQGVDVWINNPRRPWEASGTSGMKVLVNGGLNLSSLDGWWAEAYSPEVGWALGDGREHPAGEWDRLEAEQLYHLLEEEVIPEFYNRNGNDLPEAWIRRIRASMAHLTPRFSSNRMVREYAEKIYLPAAAAFQQRMENRGSLAKELRNWEETLTRFWNRISWGKFNARQEPDGWSFEVLLEIGGIPADFVQVQLYAESANSEKAVRQEMNHEAPAPGTPSWERYTCRIRTSRPAGDFTPRLLPYHPEAQVPLELNLISWYPR